VIKDSVTIIDTKPEGVDDTLAGLYPVDFSNHWAYEERESGNIIVLTPFRPDLTRFDGCINRYEINLQ
jgi:hypothetical protein